MNKTILSIISVAVIVGGASFYGGMRYAKSSAASAGTSQFGAFRGANGEGANAAGIMQSGRRIGGMRGGFVAGEIISKDDKSVIVKLQDGSSKIVFFFDATEIGKIATGASSDLETGKTVMVTGTTNQDGSITAQSIQLR